MKFSERVKGAFQFIFCRKIKEAALTKEINKDYSDMLDYVKKVIKTSSAVKEEDENENVHTFIKQRGKRLFECKIYHTGNYVYKIEVLQKSRTPVYDINSFIEKIDKSVKDYVFNASDFKLPPPKNVDYTLYSLEKLVERLEINLHIFKRKPNKYTLSDLDAVRNAINDRVKGMSSMPVAQRDKFSVALGHIDTHINTLKMQLCNPLTAKMAGHFVRTYIPQIQLAVSEIAAAL